MKLVKFAAEDGARWGRLEEEGKVTPLGASLDGIAEREGGEPVALDAAAFLPPVAEGAKVLCVGLNYRDHVLEMGRELPSKPVVFTRFPDTFVADGRPLRLPEESGDFDFEGEFAIVIGRAGRRIAREDALEHVLGYTIMNDGSLRDFQNHGSQFTPGKNFPESGALGPCIVTRDEFGPVEAQRVETVLNGETVQSSGLDQLIFDVEDLIAYVSSWTDLRPGDVIATGTPGGVGAGRSPKLWMKAGDEVSITIDGIGTLANTVAAAS